jgi:hypothetical protein
MLVLLAGGLVLSGCGVVRESDAPRGNFTLEQARQFAEFPLYYAGDRVSGLPLVAVLRRNDTANYVSFVYGDCSPGDLEQGCAPPAEIQVWPKSSRNLDSYDASASGAPAPVPVPVRTAIRGVPSAFLDDGRLEIYAARSTVVIFAGTREQALAIANAVRCLTAVDVVEPGSRKPLGTLAC